MWRFETGPDRALPAVWLCALTALAAPAVGDEPGAGAGTPAGVPLEDAALADIRVTWADLVASVDRHPSIAGAEHNREAAVAGVAAARAAPNPKLEGTAALGRARDGSEARFEWGLTLDLPLDWLARRGAEIDSAKSSAVLAEAEAAMLRQAVLLELRSLFWALVAAQERVTVLQEMHRQAEALHETVRKRVAMGETRPVEETRIAVETGKTVGNLEAADIVLRGRRAQLSRWLSADSPARIVAVADVATLPSPMTPEAVLQAVGRAHPAMAVQDAQIRSLAAGVALERRERFPDLSAQVFTEHGLDSRAYGGGVSITLPLWSWNRAGIVRAEKRLSAGEAQAAAARLALETAAIELQAQCQAGVTRAAHYRDHILPNARVAARTTERTYALGEAPLLEVIDARGALIEIQSAFLDALIDAQTECSRLNVLIGEE